MQIIDSTTLKLPFLKIFLLTTVVDAFLLDIFCLLKRLQATPVIINMIILIGFCLLIFTLLSK